MPTSVLTGSRIRQHRLDQGLKQADLAKAAGISASYLNLIEHNRRRIGGKLLIAISEGLGIDPQFLSEGGGARVVTGLTQLAVDADANIEVERVDEFAGRFPGWAGFLLAQQDRINALERMVGGLNDRLTHDPVLSEKMHEVLSTASAIRSTASILMETPDIAPDWRHRFHSNIDAESRRLAETSAAMAAHFDRLTRRDDRFTTPLEQLDAFFNSQGFCIDAIEQEGEAAIEKVLRSSETLASTSARDLARSRLEAYAKVAQAIPVHAFLTQARGAAFDPGVLSMQFKCDLPTIFRRLAHLPAQPDLPEIAYVECDSAGAFLLRRPAPGFPMPRFGAACPLWPLFTALTRPNLPLRDQVRVPDGKTFDAYAIAVPQEDAAFSVSPTLRAMMLLVEAEGDYADANAVGSSCRVCPLESCTARREPSVLHVT